MIYSVQNVTMLGLFGSYSNTLLYNLWDIEAKESTQKGAAIMASYIANPLLFTFLVLQKISSSTLKQ